MDFWALPVCLLQSDLMVISFPLVALCPPLSKDF